MAIAREDLTIDVGLREAAVRAVLRLSNHGDDAKLNVGFPCEADLAKEVAGLTCKTKLDVRVDGKKVAARLEKEHWVWPMSFVAGKEVELVVSYKAPLKNDRYETPFYGMGLLHYRLQTGAAWAGPIGELHMEVRLPTDVIVYVSPGGYTRGTGTLTWSIENQEPDRDLVVIVHPMFVGRYAHALKAATRDELQARVAKGDFSADELLALVAEMRSDREMDETITYARWFQGDIAKNLGLGEPPEEGVRATLAESLRLMEATAAKGKRSQRAP